MKKIKAKIESKRLLSKPWGDSYLVKINGQTYFDNAMQDYETNVEYNIIIDGKTIKAVYDVNKTIPLEVMCKE